MRTSLSIACAALIGLGSTASAQRSTQDGALAATYHALHAQRFPSPSGASLARAERLGLRGAGDALRLLHEPPPAAWVRAAPSSAATTLRWPVDDGRYGRGFGFVRTMDRGRRHDGVDVVAPRGSVVRAVEAGLVAYSGDGVRGFGNCLVLVHANGWVSVYAHNDRLTVPTGYRVRRGERIAFVGSTGIAQGPHLHFELIVGGEAVDPMPHFRGRPWVAARARWEAGEIRHRRDHLGAIEADYSVEATPTPTATPTPNPTPTPSPTAMPSPRPSPRPTPTPSPTPSSSREALADAVRLLSSAPRAAELAGVPGRRFGTLLWPLRGARAELVGAREHAELAVRDALGTPVRAVADGRVVYVGEGLDGRGLAVVLLHPNGWVSVHAALAEATPRAGDAVLRGEWIGRVGAAPFRFELRHEGRALDPRSLFVQVPVGVCLGGDAPDTLATSERP